MSFRTLILYMLLLALSLNGCGVEVVDMELPAGPPKLVVEGRISNLPGPQRVKLSWSTSFKSNEAVYEEDALIIISDSQGRQDTLQYEGKGEYSFTLSGVPGLVYQLTIHLEEEKYEAVSIMPPPAKIGSYSIEHLEESLVREEGYYVTLHQLDSLEKEGYYRWLVWVNDTLKPSSIGLGYFATHQLNKDNTPLSIQYPDPFKKGDSVLVQTIKMDKEVYTYYQGVIELMANDGGLLGPVPVNPPSNISNGALGVFQAISIVEHRFVIE